MKSLLVDALRQKEEGRDGDSLSDSGSFATSRADLAAAPIDETGASQDSDDLELMATGRFIVANDEEPQKLDDIEDAGVDKPDHAGLAETIAGETTCIVEADVIAPVRESLPSMPPVARYAPLACAALALAAALTWFGIRQLELLQEQSTLSTSASALRGAATAGEHGIAATSPRFRYLDVEGRPLDDEVWQ